MTQAYGLFIGCMSNMKFQPAFVVWKFSSVFVAAWLISGVKSLFGQCLIFSMLIFFVVFLRQGFPIAIAGLEYVDQSGLDLTELHLPLSPKPCD